MKRGGGPFTANITKQEAMMLIKPDIMGDSIANMLKIHVMCKEYPIDNREEGDDDWTSVESEDWVVVKRDDDYKTFAIWI